VYKRDGRLVPFEADKISRALFAATERLGSPDAFLARELTDSILHFLGKEGNEAIPTTAWIAETVFKVTRELGQPALAQAFADQAARSEPETTVGKRERGLHEADGPDPAVGLGKQPGPSWDDLRAWVEAAPDPLSLSWRVSRSCLRAYSLREVFARDLVAAHRDGLLTFTTLESPRELAGCVLGAPTRCPLGEAVFEARGLAGDYLALDGPEYGLSLVPGGTPEPADLVRELAASLRPSGFRAVVNLNCGTPPGWADGLAEGPLFAGQRTPPSARQLAGRADSLLDLFLGIEHAAAPRPSGETSRPAPLLRMDWHLGDRDCHPAEQDRLLRLARRLLEHPALAVVFDRPRRPVALAEGLDRQHPAVLLTVGLNLPLLAERAGVRTDPARLLGKLRSLARLALSAAVQKRDFLRRQRRDRPAFLYDRARLVVAPVGLEAVVSALFGRGLCAGGPGLEFARDLLGHLRAALDEDGRAYHLATSLDAPADVRLGDPPVEPDAPFPLPPATRVAGITAWDPQAPPKQQLRASGRLQAVTEAGTAAVLLGGERLPTAETVADLLVYAWRHTEVARLRFVLAATPHRQLAAPW
jgi:hypothetical protein